MLLESGDSLCADGLLLEGFNFQVKESALTGEAQAVNKSVTPSGFQKMIYSHTNHPRTWKTMVFTTLCLAQMDHALAMASNTLQIWQQVSPSSSSWHNSSTVDVDLCT